MKIFKISSILIMIALFAFSSCKKEEENNEEQEQNPSTSPDLSLQFLNQWGSETFMYNTVYDINGVDVRFQDVRFYLSNFSLDSNDGQTNTIDDVILVDAGNTENVDLSDLNYDGLSGIDFLLGLDSLTNHADPTIADAPLNDGTMHWGWDPASGYKFIKIEGESDVDGDGTFDSFSIHAATDGLKRSISKSISKDAENNTLVIMTTVDYSQWFENVDFASGLSGTHGNSDLTNDIADQVDDSIDMN